MLYIFFFFFAGVLQIVVHAYGQGKSHPAAVQLLVVPWEHLIKCQIPFFLMS